MFDERDLAGVPLIVYLEGLGMLTDPGSIQKVRDGMVKMGDASDKFCTAMLEGSTSAGDKEIMQAGIDVVALGKLTVSRVLPPEGT